MVKNLPVHAGDAGSSPGLGTSLEQEMATHSSILAWRMPWTEEPGGLLSTGSQRVGHDEHACLHTPSFRKADSPPACVHQVIVILTKSSDIPVLSHLCSSST